MTAFRFAISRRAFAAPLVISTVLCAATASVHAQSLASQATIVPRPGNLINTKFATVSSGSQSTVRVAVRASATDAETRDAVAERVKQTWRAQAQVLRHSSAKFFPEQTTVMPVSTLVQVERNGVPITRAFRTRAVGGGTLTFRYTGWAEQDQRLIQRLITEFYPRIEALYGKPAVSGEVEIFNLGTVDSNKGTERQRLSFGAYDVSSNRILLPLYVSNDSFAQALLLNLIHAFHGPAVFQYDAWEQGFARAAASVIARDPAFGFPDASANNLLSLLKYYDLLNQPGLGNPTFFPPAQANVQLEGKFTLGKMTFPRMGMSGAAWLKVYIENPNFFRQFNEAYYAQFDPAQSPSLAGNTPALKTLAVSFLQDGVEGYSFEEWYRRQYILDTSVSAGRKLYAFVIPGVYSDAKGQANAVQLMYFRTKPGGDEDLLNGRVYGTYHDSGGATIGLGIASEQVELADGEGSITTLSLQPEEGRLTLDFAVGSETARTYVPGGFSGDFQGVILGKSAGATRVQITRTTATGTQAATPQMKGASFTANLGGGDNDLGKAVITYTDTAGQTRTFRKNTGDGQAFLILRPDQTGGENATLTRSFAIGTVPYFVSFPLQPTATGVGEALSLNTTDFVLSRWDAVESRYGTVTPDANSSIGSLAPGRGYWFKPAPVDRSRPELLVQLSGAPPVTDVDFAVATRFGWNMVGSPFTADTTNVSDIQVQYQNNSLFTWEKAVENNLVAAKPYRFDRTSGQFVETDTINAPEWEGVFVRVLVPGSVTLLLPAPDVTRSRSARSRATADKPKPDWAVTVRTHQSADANAGFFGREAKATFGVVRGATDAYDNAYDREEPPPAINSVGAVFDAPAPAGGKSVTRSAGGRFVSDFRDAGKRKNEWAFTSLAAVPGAVRLSWENIGTVPRNLSLVLRDPETGASVSLRNRSSYTWQATDTVRSRRFVFSVAPARSVPLMLTNVQISRDTTRAANGSRSYGITYNMTADAEVVAELSTLNGKTVRRLDTGGRSVVAGRQSLRWDGRAQDGSPLPAGAYQLRITAAPRDGDGQPVTILRPVMVLN